MNDLWQKLDAAEAGSLFICLLGDGVFVKQHTASWKCIETGAPWDSRDLAQHFSTWETNLLLPAAELERFKV